MKRRSFMAMSVMGVLGVASSRRTSAKTQPLSEFKYGESRLGISDDDRDATLYVTKRYKPGVGTPIVMMLHGFMGSGEGSRGFFPLAEEFGVIILAPESRSLTWGQGTPGFDEDVHYLGPAYRHVANLVDLDAAHVALGG